MAANARRNHIWIKPFRLANLRVALVETILLLSFKKQLSYKWEISFIYIYTLLYFPLNET